MRGAQRVLLINPELTSWTCALRRRLLLSWPTSPRQRSIPPVCSSTSWSESTARKKETTLRSISSGDTLGQSTTVSHLSAYLLIRYFRSLKKKIHHHPIPPWTCCTRNSRCSVNNQLYSKGEHTKHEWSPTWNRPSSPICQIMLQKPKSNRTSDKLPAMIISSCRICCDWDGVFCFFFCNITITCFQRTSMTRYRGSWRREVCWTVSVSAEGESNTTLRPRRSTSTATPWSQLTPHTSMQHILIRDSFAEGHIKPTLCHFLIVAIITNYHNEIVYHDNTHHHHIWKALVYYLPFSRRFYSWLGENTDQSHPPASAWRDSRLFLLRVHLFSLGRIAPPTPLSSLTHFHLPNKGLSPILSWIPSTSLYFSTSQHLALCSILY